MPTLEDTANILGYFRESWADPAQNREEVNTYAMSMERTIERMQTPFERWPVRNREERTLISSQKRAIIHQRDGNVCKPCGKHVRFDG